MSFATGLNNIPIADVVPEDLLVLQGCGEFGHGRTPCWYMGMEYGVAENYEITMDDRVAGTGETCGPIFQVKRRFPLALNSACAVGLANISDERERNGNPFPYLVVSQDLGAVNAHLGHGWQKDDQAWFVGVDRAVTPKLTLRADWTEVEDGEESLASFGFIQDMDTRWAIETWASFPSAAGEHTAYVAKLNYTISLQ